MKKNTFHALILLASTLMMASCTGNSSSSTYDDSDSTNYGYDDFIIDGDNTPTNTGSSSNSNCTCPECGYTYDYYDARRMFLVENGMCSNCYRNKYGSSSSGNKYRSGYDQGYEDARHGNTYDDSDGNGQYRKGYEDGYSDGE